MKPHGAHTKTRDCRDAEMPVHHDVAGVAAKTVHCFMPMSRRPARDPDTALIRAAGRRMAWQIAVACVAVVVVVAVLTFVVGPLLHPGNPADAASGDDDDALLRDGLLVAGSVGILVAGLVGFLAARRAVAPLEKALALQRRFVADAGHELRTPLAVLHTRAQLLARRIPPDDPSRSLVDQLLADSRALGEIVEEMLISAQLAADPGTGELLDPGELIADTVTSMSVLAADAGVTLTQSAQSSPDGARFPGGATPRTDGPRGQRVGTHPAGWARHRLHRGQRPMGPAHRQRRRRRPRGSGRGAVDGTVRPGPGIGPKGSAADAVSASAFRWPVRWPPHTAEH